MPRSIRFAAVARRHVATIGEWWLANRPDNPALFVDELDTALALCSDPRVAGPLPGGVSSAA